MVVINYSCAFTALKMHVEAYNNLVDYKDRIKPSVLLTAKEIIRIYGASLIKANQIGKINRLCLPSLRTNNVQLGNLTLSSKRTIQRHISRLRKAGVITKKKNHGTNSDYELWLNPSIVLSRHYEKSTAHVKKSAPVNFEKENQHEEESFSSSVSTCRHTDNRDNRYYKKELLIPVEKVRYSLPLMGVSGNGNINGNSSKNGDAGNVLPLWLKNWEAQELSKDGSARIDSVENLFKSANPVENPPKTSLPKVELPLWLQKPEVSNSPVDDSGEKEEDENEMEEDKPSYDAGDVAHQKEGQAEVTNPAPSRCATLSLYVDLFWNLARNLLYRDESFQPWQINQAKQLIQKLYEPMSENRMAEFHRQYCERLKLAEQYVAKAPTKRFIPLPFKYFDTSNPNGFCGTKTWYQKYRKNQGKSRSRVILRSQISKYVRNLRTGEKSNLQVFRECEVRLGKLRSPELVREFHAAVLDHHTNQQLYHLN